MDLLTTDAVRLRYIETLVANGMEGGAGWLLSDMALLKAEDGDMATAAKWMRRANELDAAALH